MDEFLSSRQTKTAVFGFGAGILSLIIFYSVSDFFSAVFLVLICFSAGIMVWMYLKKLFAIEPFLFFLLTVLTIIYHYGGFAGDFAEILIRISGTADFLSTVIAVFMLESLIQQNPPDSRPNSKE